MPGNVIEWDTYLKFVLTLILVIGMILVVAWALRRFGLAQMIPKNRGRKKKRRLSVVESANLDARRRLLLIRHDDREHLLLVGGTTDLVIGEPLAALDPIADDSSKTPSDTPGKKADQP